VDPQLGDVVAARIDGSLVLRLSGEFDLSNAWQIREVLLDAIRTERSDIVVDLAAVRFMDAQLLRSLINARRVAEERGIAIRIVPPRDPDVWRVARLVDLPLAA
jgi:anti-anti-sigma factor